jgi:hypothetical protein
MEEVKKETRDRKRPLKVVVSATERARIEAVAERCRLSVSSYLRTVGLGYEPTSRFDREHFRELVKLHADQGRLGGLLKLWLSEKKGEGAPVKNVRSLLEQIESCQMQIARIVMEEKKRL